MFLLDTNVVSELRKAALGKADKSVISWAVSVPASAMHLSVISILEIELGILLLARKDRQQAHIIQTWLEDYVLAAFGERILPIDVPVARKCAELHVPNRRAERDALIAATTLVHGFTLVTRNVADFEVQGVKILNPWQN